MKTDLYSKMFTHTTQPYGHQDIVLNKSYKHKGYALFWEMGAGKSKTLIDTAYKLWHQQEIDGVIIISDKGFYLNWSDNEIPKHSDPKVHKRVSVYSSGQSRAEENQLIELLTPQNDILDFLVVNVESLCSKKAEKLINGFIDSHYCLIILDESTSIKNPKAKRTKAAIKYANKCDYKRIATGTPITQSPLDLYTQARFLGHDLGFKTYTSFKSYFAKMVTMTMGNRSFPKIVGYRNLEELTTIIKPWSSRLLKKECVDLPDKVYQTVYVQQTPEQKKLYNQLKDEALVELGQGILTSANALTTLGRLHQINSGHLKYDDNCTIEIDNNRCDTLVDLIQSIGTSKAIVWCNFRHDVEIISKAFKKADINYVEYVGRTEEDDRKSALLDFTKNKECQVFLATPRVAGKSLTLVEATYSIYYNNSFSLESRLQSEDRNHRIGQKSNVTYIDIVCPKTVDEKVLGALKTKKQLSDTVIDGFKELV